jgi:hypothetical protein
MAVNDEGEGERGRGSGHDGRGVRELLCETCGITRHLFSAGPRHVLVLGKRGRQVASSATAAVGWAVWDAGINS